MSLSSLLICDRTKFRPNHCKRLSRGTRPIVDAMSSPGSGQSREGVNFSVLVQRGEQITGLVSEIRYNGV